MRRGRDGENGKKIMMFIVATNVVASRPPERRPTGTPHARANYGNFIDSRYAKSQIFKTLKSKILLKLFRFWSFAYELNSSLIFKGGKFELGST